MADSQQIDSVYAVAWPEHNLVKVGYSHLRRWRTFTARGGLLILNESFPTSTEAFAREASLHARIGAKAARAFNARGEAMPFLGGSGGGWLECYRMSVEEFTEVIDGG